MKNYFEIQDLIPLESKYEIRKLIYLTMFYRKYKNFEGIHSAEVGKLNKGLILLNGNHRAIWLSINGFSRIEAEERLLSFCGDIEFYKKIAERNLAMGIISPYDLAKKIPEEEKKHFGMEGKLFKEARDFDYFSPKRLERIDISWINLL